MVRWKWHLGKFICALYSVLFRCFTIHRFYVPQEYQNLRRMCAALQYLQAFIYSVDPTTLNPNLVDIATLVSDMQKKFGADSPLEAVIQALVVQDLELQHLERLERKQKKAAPVPQTDVEGVAA